MDRPVDEKNLFEEVMTDKEFLEWCEERNYEALEELGEWYDSLEN